MKSFLLTTEAKAELKKITGKNINKAFEKHGVYELYYTKHQTIKTEDTKIAEILCNCKYC